MSYLHNIICIWKYLIINMELIIWEYFLDFNSKTFFLVGSWSFSNWIVYKNHNNWFITFFYNYKKKKWYRINLHFSHSTWQTCGHNLLEGKSVGSVFSLTEISTQFFNEQYPLKLLKVRDWWAIPWIINWFYILLPHT